MRQDEASAIVRATIGSNIAALREERGLSQAALAKEAQVDRSHLGRIERGTENTSMDILVCIADGLEVPLMDLFRGLEECSPRKLPERHYRYAAVKLPPDPQGSIDRRKGMKPNKQKPPRASGEVGGI